MKLVLLATALIASPLAAQTKPAPTASTPAPTASATPAPTPTMPAGKLTLDTPIETIIANPAGKAVLEADFPGMTSHPLFEQFKGMSLNQLQPVSQGAITDAQLAKVKTDLAAVK